MTRDVRLSEFVIGRVSDDETVGAGAQWQGLLASTESDRSRMQSQAVRSPHSGHTVGAIDPQHHD